MEHSFAGAVSRLKEHYGFELSTSVVSRITLKHASAIAAMPVSDPHLLPASGKAQIVAEADGSFLRIVSNDKHRSGDRRKSRKVDYREARLCAATAEGSQAVFYAATFEDVDEVGFCWAKTAKEAGMGLDSKVHVVCDGATWIREQAANAFGGQGKVLIDFYHVCEYLAQAGQSLEDSPKRWLKVQKKRLREGRIVALIKELNRRLEPKNTPEEDAPVRRALRYLQNRIDALDYKQAICEKLPIGSGLIESGHKHVLQARMKIPGAAWKIQNAEAMAQARAFRANQQWNLYWQAAA
jgi:hypothetical protein